MKFMFEMNVDFSNVLKKYFLFYDFYTYFYFNFFNRYKQ